MSSVRLGMGNKNSKSSKYRQYHYQQYLNRDNHNFRSPSIIQETLTSPSSPRSILEHSSSRTFVGPFRRQLSQRSFRVGGSLEQLNFFSFPEPLASNLPGVEGSTEHYDSQHAQRDEAIHEGIFDVSDRTNINDFSIGTVQRNESLSLFLG